MNLEDMKKVWDSDSNQTLYVIDQFKMDQMVNKKSMSANRRASYVENFIIIMNVGIPIIIFTLTGLCDSIGFGEYSIGLLTLATAAGTYYYKKVRQANQLNEGDSVLNNLDQAIHNATYQSRLSKFLLTWYIGGIAILSIFHLILEKTNLWFILMITVTFIIALVVGRWEQRCLHDKKRNELIDLKRKLQE